MNAANPKISFNFPRFSWSTLELSFSSKRLLVEFKLALYGFLSTYLHTNSIISFLHLRCMVGSGLWIWAKEQPISWGSFRAQSILAPLDGMFITEWTDIECAFLWTYTLPSSRHRKLTEHGRCMQNNQLPTEILHWGRGELYCAWYRIDLQMFSEFNMWVTYSQLLWKFNAFLTKFTWVLWNPRISFYWLRFSWRTGIRYCGCPWLFCVKSNFEWFVKVCIKQGLIA